MSRTFRFYNFKNNVKGMYHRYQQFCCGNCRMCKDPTVSKKRRLTYLNELRREIGRLFE